MFVSYNKREWDLINSMKPQHKKEYLFRFGNIEKMKFDYQNVLFSLSLGMAFVSTSLSLIVIGKDIIIVNTAIKLLKAAPYMIMLGLLCALYNNVTTAYHIGSLHRQRTRWLKEHGYVMGKWWQ